MVSFSLKKITEQFASLKIHPHHSRRSMKILIKQKNKFEYGGKYTRKAHKTTISLPIKERNYKL